MDRYLGTLGTQMGRKLSAILVWVTFLTSVSLQSIIVRFQDGLKYLFNLPRLRIMSTMDNTPEHGLGT